MVIYDFAWREDTTPLPALARPFVVFYTPIQVPADDQLPAEVDSTIFDSDPSEQRMSRRFTCSVIINSWERDSYGGWREKLRPRLIDECRTRWNE